MCIKLSYKSTHIRISNELYLSSYVVTEVPILRSMVASGKHQSANTMLGAGWPAKGEMIEEGVGRNGNKTEQKRERINQ